jgi:predicted nucleotidyltransferase
MTSAEAIIAHVRALARAVPCERVVLFGSYACGKPTADSDVDLLVIRRFRGDEVAEAARLRLAVEVDYPCDILIKTPIWLRRRLADGCVVFKGIMEKGIVLHDRDDPRVGEQGRRRLRLRHAGETVAEEVEV